MIARASLFLILLAACGTDAPTRLLPGPCTSESDAEPPMRCTFEYDAAGTWTGADCETDPREDREGPYGSRWEWTAQHEDTALVGLTIVGATFGASEEVTTQQWTFGPEGATVEQVFTLDQALTVVATTMQLEADAVPTRHPFELHAFPDADDALLAVTTQTEWEGELASTEEHTFTYDGPPRPASGTRTQTRDDGETETFRYDDRGRRVDSFYAYDGDLMIAAPGVTYQHDGFGNLLRRTEGGVVTSYDYGCWE